MSSEVRQVLEDWIAYYDRNGHSTGLKERTLRLLEPVRFIPTPEETHRMENDGEPPA